MMHWLADFMWWLCDVLSWIGMFLGTFGTLFAIGWTCATWLISEGDQEIAPAKKEEN